MYMSMNGSPAIMEKLRAIAKKTKSPVAQELAKDNEYGEACSIAHQLFNEMFEEFEEGEMTWEEAIKDLYENLKAVDMPKPPEVEEEEEEKD